VIGDDVPEVVALLLRQGRGAAGGVGPAGGVFEGHRAIGVDWGGFEQLLAAPQVFFADDVLFAVGAEATALDVVALGLQLMHNGKCPVKSLYHPESICIKQTYKN